MLRLNLFLQGVLASVGWRQVWQPSQPPRWIQEPSVVRDRDGKPQENPLAVHCFCLCSGSVLLGDLLGVSRSRERDLLSVLFIYPRFYVYVYHRILCFLFCYNLMHVRCFGLVVNTFAPLPFGRICCVVLVTRKGGESSWIGPWHLGYRYIGSFVFHVHSYKDQFIQPVWAECVLCSLGLYFVCLYCFDLFVSPSFCVSLSSWVISLTGFGAGVSNLIEPPRALATSTTAWVRS